METLTHAFRAAAWGALLAALPVAACRKPEPPREAAAADSSVTSEGVLIRERSAGRPDAPLTIYEFSDFQCPYCRRFALDIWPALEREYIATGKARVIFVNYPIARIHPNATAAHDLAMCAARQDRFWPVHDLLFRHQAEWAKSPEPLRYFERMVAAEPLDHSALRTCARERSEGWIVDSDTRSAEEIGLAGTPAFIVNGGLLTGAQPVEVWRPILDSMHRAATGGR